MAPTHPRDPDLDTLNLVGGPDIDDRATQAQINDACEQEGAQDAAKGLYDKHSFHPDRPLLFEHKIRLWLEKYAEGALIRQWKDERAAMHLVSRARAEATHAAARLEKVRTAGTAVDNQVTGRLGDMTDPTKEGYVPNVLVQTAPAGPDQGKPQATRTWNIKLLIYVILGAIGEFAVNVLAGYILGEEEWKTWLLAGLVTFITVAIPLQSAPALLAKGKNPIGKTIAWAALGFLALVVAGFAWIRYTYMKDAVETALTAAQQTGQIIAGGPAPAHLDPLGSTMLILLNVALPLCLALLIFMEVLHNKQPLITELRHLRHEQSNLTQELQLLEKITLLAHQQAADAEHDYRRIPEQTKHYLRALVPMVAEGLHCYILGVARAASDPTITAHLQDNAHAFAERYDTYAKQVISEYITRVNEPASSSRINHWRVDSDGIIRATISPEPAFAPANPVESTTDDTRGPGTEWTVPSEWEPSTEGQSPHA